MDPFFLFLRVFTLENLQLWLHSWCLWDVYVSFTTTWDSFSRASQVAEVVTNPPANAGDVRDAGSIPGSGRSPGEGNGNPIQYSCLKKPHGQRSYIPEGCKESDRTEATLHSKSYIGTLSRTWEPFLWNVIIKKNKTPFFLISVGPLLSCVQLCLSAKPSSRVLTSINTGSQAQTACNQTWDSIFSWVLLCLVTQLCATFCDPSDCKLDVTVHGIFQARILEWIAISFTEASDPGIGPEHRVSPELRADSLPTEPSRSATSDFFFFFCCFTFPM